MERARRKESIVNGVGRFGPALTADGIAKTQPAKNAKGHMSKSPHLIELLEEMVEEGMLVCQWAEHNNRQLTRYFSLPSHAPRLLK